MLQNVIIGWIVRRFLEIGGTVGTLLTAWNNLPPATQEAILQVLGQNWQTITLGALAPIGAALWGYVWSALSTFKPQVVTSGRKQIALSAVGAKEAEAIAKLRPARRTLWERLTGK